MTGAVVALVALSGSVMAADVTNGGFEAGPFSDPGHLGYQELPAGSTQLGPWTITSGSVDWISTYWAPASGSKSIDLAGREPGTISQTVATTAGKTYVVSFMLAGNTDSANNPAGGPAVKTLSVAATGSAPATYTFDTTGKTPTSMGWTAKTYSFRATGPSTTVTFTNTSAGYYGAALDQIEVDCPDRRCLQEQRLEVDAGQRRQLVQEPGRLRQLLCHGRTQSRGDRQLAVTATLITTALDLPQQAGAASCPDDGRVGVSHPPGPRRARSTGR